MGKDTIFFDGKIALIKMSILPRILFLFQTIPINIEKPFFKSLKKTINKFIWNSKTLRIRAIVLQDQKTRGGLMLPDFEIYYKAAILAWIREWIVLKNKRLLILEGHDLLYGWHKYLWYM